MKRDPREILRQYHLKNTPVRTDVLEVLLSTRVALSHADIKERLKGKDIDKVTLYRTLNSFTEKGLTHKVATDDRNWLYAIFDEDLLHPETEHNHAHFVCNKCEKIYCLPAEEGAFANMGTINPGFRIMSREVRLHGLCPICN